MESKQQYNTRPRQRRRRNTRQNSSRRIRGPQTGRDAAPGMARGSLDQGFTIKSMPLFGYRRRCNVQYYTTGTVTSGASAAGAYVFSANGLFDPDITGTGGQPMGFDQMMQYFNHYTVHSSRIRVEFLSVQSTTCTVGLAVSGSSTVTTVIENLIENGDIQFRQLGTPGQYGSQCTLARNLNVGLFQTVTDVMDDPNMRGDAASNPTEQAYYHLCAWNITSAAAVSAFFQVLIEYDVTFHEPRKGPLS